MSAGTLIDRAERKSPSGRVWTYLTTPTLEIIYHNQTYIIGRSDGKRIKHHSL